MSILERADRFESGPLIWDVMLDKRYVCAVHRTGEYDGVLTVHDGTTELLREPVTLWYGARFGPDIENVRQWEAKCAAAVDKRGS